MSDKSTVGITIHRKPRPVFLRAEKDDNGNFFLFDGLYYVPSREIVETFLQAAKNTLSLSDDAVLSYNQNNRLEQESEMVSVSSVIPTKAPNFRRTKLYMMRNARNGYVKIGISDHPEFREKTLQSEEPEIELIFVQKTDSRVEEMLHLHFADLRVRGEWFRLTAQHIEDVKDLIPKLEASL